MARDYVGHQFGELLVIAEASRRGPNRRLMCQCSCGSFTTKFVANLAQGKSRSCGCKWLDRSAKGRAAMLVMRRTRAQESDEGRLCFTCGSWKPWSEFSRDLRRTRGKASNCMECGRWRSVLSMFGITKAQWYELLARQDGVCALCFEVPVAGRRHFDVDHDHACCGRKKACLSCIRGLLCTSCNLMLGYAEKTEANSLRFVDYLRRRPFMEQGSLNEHA